MQCRCRARLDTSAAVQLGHRVQDLVPVQEDDTKKRNRSAESASQQGSVLTKILKIESLMEERRHDTMSCLNPNIPTASCDPSNTNVLDIMTTFRELSSPEDRENYFMSILIPLISKSSSTSHPEEQRKYLTNVSNLEQSDVTLSSQLRVKANELVRSVEGEIGSSKEDLIDLREPKYTSVDNHTHSVEILNQERGNNYFSSAPVLKMHDEFISDATQPVRLRNVQADEEDVVDLTSNERREPLLIEAGNIKLENGLQRYDDEYQDDEVLMKVVGEIMQTGSDAVARGEVKEGAMSGVGDRVYSNFLTSEMTQQASGLFRNKTKSGDLTELSSIAHCDLYPFNVDRNPDEDSNRSSSPRQSSSTSPLQQPRNVVQSQSSITECAQCLSCNGLQQSLQQTQLLLQQTISRVDEHGRTIEQLSRHLEGNQKLNQMEKIQDELFTDRRLLKVKAASLVTNRALSAHMCKQLVINLSDNLPLATFNIRDIKSINDSRECQDAPSLSKWAVFEMFSLEELVGRNCMGGGYVRGSSGISEMKRPFDETKMEIIKAAVFEIYPQNSETLRKSMWTKCVEKVNNDVRYLFKVSLKKREWLQLGLVGN